MLAEISLGRDRNFLISILLVLFFQIVPPLLFGLVFLPRPTASISPTNASSILTSAITVNGVFVGFVLLVLFDNATKAKKTIHYSDYRARLLLVILDAYFLMYSLREIYQEMMSLTTLPVNPTFITVIDTFVLPLRFAIYIITRVAIVILAIEKEVP